MKFWQLQEAKSKLSNLVKDALKLGPQGISVRGSEEIVVLSKKQYEELIGSKPSLTEFINQSPFKNLNLEIQRNKSKPRKIDL